MDRLILVENYSLGEVSVLLQTDRQHARQNCARGAAPDGRQAVQTHQRNWKKKAYGTRPELHWSWPQLQPKEGAGQRDQAAAAADVPAQEHQPLED